ncbi:MAG: enoyl-ACP reductase FabI [Firmicutes bacterium]|jgi:enoyl-[acyl-carrier protein] reductase I|nr:enoyl-ACP reductase FabI [Bacillota bacterium]
MAFLENKTLLITGVLTEDSLAFQVARLAEENGAKIILSGAGRGLSLTKRTAQKLSSSPEVLEIDVTVEEQLQEAGRYVIDNYTKLDGILHSIGYAPPSCLGQGMFAADWNDVSLNLNISAYSLKSLVQAFLPALRNADTASVVGLDFDASVSWPGYDWMGVAKAAYESLARYLARDLGPDNIRVNLIAAGPVKTIAAKSIPAFPRFEDVWASKAPLGWDTTDQAHAVAKACVCLLSDWFPATTGEIIHVDGGYHAVGA